MSVYARNLPASAALFLADDLAARALARELRTDTASAYAVYRRDGDYLVCLYANAPADGFTLISVAYPGDSTDRSSQATGA